MTNKPYLPLARKYRPQTFDELVGQPHVTKTLTSALEQQRMAQAYLFTGLRGVGKTSAARILAKCLNCEHGPTATPCHQCASCTQIVHGTSLDVLEIDGASNRGIDEIRSLREAVPYAPATGKFRVYIIDEVHMLTTEAFNALLKTLEEPPAHVKFIFATTTPNKVPATILSRCQRFDFRRLDATTVAETLARLAKTERWKVDEGALYAIARASEGSLRDAEVILEQLASFAGGTIHEADVTALLGLVESEALMALSQAVLERDPTTALSLLSQHFQQGKDATQLLLGLARQFRHLLILSTIQGHDPATISQLIDEPAERLAQLTQEAQRVDAQELLLCLQILTTGYELAKRSPMTQMVVELLIIKLATREAWRSLDEMHRTLERLLTQSAGVSAVPPHVPISSSPAPSAVTAPISSTSVEPPTLERAEDLTAIMTVWSAFLERLGAEKMSLAAYLTDAKPMSYADGTLTLGLPSFSLHQEVLGSPEHRRLIERLLSELTQQQIVVCFATLSVTAAPPPVTTSTPISVPPIVQDIVKAFNATIVASPRAM